LIEGSGGGQVDGSLGEMAAGIVREAGEEGWEVGFPRWREVGEIGKNCATL